MSTHIGDKRVIEAHYLPLAGHATGHGYRLNRGSQILFEILEYSTDEDGAQHVHVRFWLKFPYERQLILIEKTCIHIPADITHWNDEEDLLTNLSKRFLIFIEDSAPGTVLFRIQLASPTIHDKYPLCSTSIHQNQLVGFFIKGSGPAAL